MTAVPPKLRPVLPGEVETLRALEKAARSRYLGLPGFTQAAEGPPIAAERFAVGGTVVAEIDGRVAGYVLTQTLDGLLYVANIMVAPDASGRGVGASLLRSAERRAAEHSPPAVALTTFRAPPWNGPWFRRQGYRPMPEDRIGPGLRAILDRHATVFDMTARETLWKPSGAAPGSPG